MGIGLEKILAGNGSGELIWLTALAFLRVGDRALIVGPTYDEYARAVRLMGAAPHHCLGRAEVGYHVAPGDVARALADVRPRVVFICNPNNPTGQSHPLGAVRAWSEGAEMPCSLLTSRIGNSAPGRGPPSTWARTTFWYCDR